MVKITKKDVLNSYTKITKAEEAALRKLSVKEAIRRTELLLRVAHRWKK